MPAETTQTPRTVTWMGRPEKPINPDGPPPVRRIATGLRLQRQQAGLSYVNLARRTGRTSSTLAAAASGDRLPSRELTLDFVRGCGGDVRAWERHWLDAHAELKGVRQPPDPTQAQTSFEFGEALRTLMLWRGYDTLDRIAAITGLSRSTVRRVLTGATVPTLDALDAILKVGDLQPIAERKWAATRLRLLGLPASLDEIFRDQHQHQHPATEVLFDELRQLRRGYGVVDADLPDRVGPTLRNLCGITESDTMPATLAKLASRLHPAIAQLPEPIRECAVLGLNLLMPDRRDEAPRPMLLSARVDYIVARTDRDERTVRRRIDKAFHLLARQLLVPTREVTA